MKDAQVIVRAEPSDPHKGWLAQDQTELRNISVLQSALGNLADTVAKLQDVETLSQWRVQEIEMTAEITAEGGIRLLGYATAGVKGGITIRLTRGGGASDQS